MLTFSQSLVFHSHQHVTSCFIHISPMMLTWSLRWSDPATHGFAVGGAEAVSAGTLLWQALRNFYVPWVVGYYLAVFVLMGDYLQSRRFQTLYDRVTSQGPASKALLACFRFTGVRLELAKRALYMAMHLLFGVVTMSLAALHWRSFVAHSAFVFAICAASVWNASSYYFSVFATRYEQGLEEKVRRASSLAAQKQL